MVFKNCNTKNKIAEVFYYDSPKDTSILNFTQKAQKTQEKVSQTAPAPELVIEFNARYSG